MKNRDAAARVGQQPKRESASRPAFSKGTAMTVTTSEQTEQGAPAERVPVDPTKLQAFLGQVVGDFGAILVTRYVSLGSLLGSAAMLPVMLLFVLVAPGTPLSYVLYAAVGAGFIWLAHSDNIERLLHGTERKFDLGLLGGKRPNGS